jgi:hypothetical protein
VHQHDGFDTELKIDRYVVGIIEAPPWSELSSGRSPLTSKVECILYYPIPCDQNAFDGPDLVLANGHRSTIVCGADERRVAHEPLHRRIRPSSSFLRSSGRTNSVSRFPAIVQPIIGIEPPTIALAVKAGRDRRPPEGTALTVPRRPDGA